MTIWSPRKWPVKLKPGNYISIFSIALFGLIYINYIWSDHKKEQSQQALQIALSVEAGLSTDNILKLTASAADTSLIEYKKLKEKLIDVIAANPKSKFAYLYIRRDGKLFFLVDSEPEGSPDLSPPGQLFAEADSIDFLPFKTGKAQVTKPVTDRWGTWISIEVPIKSKLSNEIVAVLGMDYTAELWNKSIIIAVMDSCILVLILIVLVILILFSKIQNYALMDEIQNRNEAETKLIETDLKLTMLIKNLPGMAYRCKPDKNYEMIFIGESCKKITGYSADEFVTDKSVFFNDLIFPEYQEAIWRYWQTVIAEKTIFETEYPIKAASGETKWLWERGRGIFNENNKLLYLEGYIEDITGKKLNDAELIRAKEKAEESDRLKSAFLANISHEIRTPMNGILGFAELLKEPDLSPENQKEFIDIIELSGQRMLNIINDLIDISKIASGETSVKIRKTNVNEMIHELNSFFTPEVSKKNIRIDYHCGLPDESCFIETDQPKLSQIMINLIKNAIKFTDSGSVKFGYYRQDSMFNFYVTDTGAGIPEDHRKIIFERFRQGTMSLTRKHEGAGLGLAISKAYIEQLGGTISLETELGKGSTFKFNIPINNPIN